MNLLNQMRPYLSKISVYFLLLFLLPATILANLNITVQPHRSWGNAPTSNIKALCENVALHFQEQLRDENKVEEKIIIFYNSGNPIAKHSTTRPHEYKVGLTVTGTYWSQFAYQFGHEFCHILHRFEKSPDGPNDWFYESICELANLWVIRRMGKTWAYRAPYANWVDYRHALLSYADGLLRAPNTQYTGTGKEWLQEWEERMRRKESGVFRYDRVAQLSYKFLFIFEENPEAWNAVRQMPVSNAKMSEYMREWHQIVNSQDKRFVEAIAKEMGISVSADTIVSINADVNDDGYVDLSDVLIVRSGTQHTSSYDTDVNNDGITDEIDVLIVKAKAVETIAAAAPSKRKIKLKTWAQLKVKRR